MKKLCYFLLFIQSFVFANDLHSFKINGKYGYINQNLNVVIAPQYDGAEEFQGDYAIVINKSKIDPDLKYYSVIDKNNNYVDVNLTQQSKLVRYSQNIFFDNFNSKYYDISKRIEVKDLSKYSQPYKKNPKNSFYFARIIYDSDNFTTEYIDEKMNVITFSKDWLKSYAMVDDMAFVIKKDWKQVVINQKGEEIISYVFDSGTNASEGLLAVITNKESGYINNKGEFVFHCKFEPNSHEFFPPGIDYPFSEGVAAVQTKNGYYTIYDNKGNILMPESSYTEVQPSSEGVLLYKKADNNKYGFINKQGKNIFTEEFDYAESFYNHFATIVYKNEDAIIDKEGNVYLVKDLINGNKNVYKNVLVKE